MVAEFSGGFAVVGAGAWLFGRAQPAAVRGTLKSRGLKGFVCPDRAALSLCEIAESGSAHCAASDRPFLTRIDCGAPVTAVSDKVLVAPAEARSGARLLRVVPMSFARAIRTTEFSSEWVVMATRSRTARVALADGESLGVRPDAAVAWTGARPTGFCPRLRLLDVLLPRGPRDLLLHFHGPAIVWIEGSEPLPLRTAAPRRAVF